MAVLSIQIATSLICFVKRQNPALLFIFTSSVSGFSVCLFCWPLIYIYITYWSSCFHSTFQIVPHPESPVSCPATSYRTTFSICVEPKSFGRGLIQLVRWMNWARLENFFHLNNPKTFETLFLFTIIESSWNHLSWKGQSSRCIGSLLRYPAAVAFVEVC